MVGPLALAFVEAARGGQGAARLAADVLAELEAYEWPGNVRELKGRDRPRRRPGPRRRHRGQAPDSATRRGRPAAGPGERRPGRGAVRRRTRSAPRESGLRRRSAISMPSSGPTASGSCARWRNAAGNQTRAAKMLGISRTAFVTKLRIYRIRGPT